MTTRNMDGLRRWAPALLVASAAMAAFWPALSAGFVNWDDGVFVVENPLIRGLSAAHLRAMLISTRGGLWLPLTWFSYALDHAAWGLEPGGFHLTNLLLHAASSVVFYAVCLRLFEGRRTAAAFAALFFAVHPLRVESVAWIAERKGLLSGLFLLLAALAHLEGRAWAAAGAFALALSAKATAIVLPGALLLLEIYPLGRLPGRPSRWLEPRFRAAWRPLVPLFLLSAAALTAGILAAGFPPERAAPGAAWRFDRVVYGLLFYPWKTLWPAALSPYYPPRPWFGLLGWRSFASAAVLLAALGALARWGRSRPALPAAFGFYGVMMLPVVGLVQQGLLFSACDRYSYLPCLGFAALFGAAAGRSRPAAALAVVWLAALGAASWRQCSVWRDSSALWTAAYERAPGAVVGANIGADHVKAGRFSDGRAWLERALREDRGQSLVYENLGLAARGQGREDEARVYWRAGLAAAPSPELDALLGNSFAKERGPRLAAGVMLLRAAVAGEPERAAWRADLGAALARRGRASEAEASYSAAIALEPGLGRAHNNLGLLLERRGEEGEALRRYRAALRDPESRAEANHNLGNARLRAGRLVEAERRFREALRVDPALAPARVNLGNILARRGDFEGAAALYRAALETSPGSVEARANLDAISPRLRR